MKIVVDTTLLDYYNELKNLNVFKCSAYRERSEQQAKLVKSFHDLIELPI